MALLSSLKAATLRWGRRAWLALLAGAYRGWPVCLTPSLRYRLLLGTLYPAYASYKAVRNKDVREYVRWMMYWIVFALFMATETITDTFISWFPFYYEIKMAFVVWLLSPYTKGASLLYRKFVHPTLSSKEKEIDHFICQAKERGYESLVSLGKRSINVAATAAIQGQGALAGRLRSFSMQDLRSMPETAVVHYSDPLYLEEQQLCRRPIGHRPAGQQPVSDSNEEEEEEDFWSDSELSARSRGCHKDPALPKPLARSQSLRQGKKKLLAKESSSRGVRSPSRGVRSRSRRQPMPVDRDR